MTKEKGRRHGQIAKSDMVKRVLFNLAERIHFPYSDLHLNDRERSGNKWNICNLTILFSLYKILKSRSKNLKKNLKKSSSFRNWIEISNVFFEIHFIINNMKIEIWSIFNLRIPFRLIKQSKKREKVWKKAVSILSNS